MLLGLIHPDQGEIFIKGEAFKRSRVHLLRHIGAIIERSDMYGYLSGWDNLRMMALLADNSIGSKRMYEVLELVGLKGREKDKVKAYSQGMKQRLGIAIALVHDPDLLILDEPTNGLDPQGIAEIRQLIIHLSSDLGKTVLVSSHLLYEVEQMATEMLIIHKGNKVIEGNVRELMDPGETLFDIRLRQDFDLQNDVRQSTWKQHLVSANDEKLTFKMHPERMPDLNRWLVQHNAAVIEIRSRHSLEDYFLSLTNEATNTAGTI